MVKKLKCTGSHGSLIEGHIYTFISKEEINGEEFITVEEVDNGNNSFYSWRFKEFIPELNKNVNVL